MAENKPKTFKKCRSCGLDCTVVRARAIEKVVSEVERRKIIVSMFGDSKPKYGTDNCPKR